MKPTSLLKLVSLSVVVALLAACAPAPAPETETIVQTVIVEKEGEPVEVEVEVLVTVEPEPEMDEVSLRLNWMAYGSHAIFYYGRAQGFYEEQNIDLTIREGNGSGNGVRLVANKDSTFSYGSSSTMMNLITQELPVVSVASVDAMGTDACMCRPDSGITEIAQLEGATVMTTAGAGVNTLFPVALANAGVDIEKVNITNVAEAALVSSYLANLGPCILAGIDDKPAQIEAEGGEPPVIFPYSDYGVDQVGYSIVAHKDMVTENPDLIQRFVYATVKSMKATLDDPDAAIAALADWFPAEFESEEDLAKARKQLDVTSAIFVSGNNTDGILGYNVAVDWESTLDLLKEFAELETDMTAEDFYTNEFVPESVE